MFNNAWKAQNCISSSSFPIFIRYTTKASKLTSSTDQPSHGPDTDRKVTIVRLACLSENDNLGKTGC